MKNCKAGVVISLTSIWDPTSYNEGATYTGGG
ncbi:hypothetical protein FORC84_p008 (plasmid) [Campylobacter jejuni]|nr:hypothetical protein FORC84_p008 [Campylobacter jejuni]